MLIGIAGGPETDRLFCFESKRSLEKRREVSKSLVPSQARAMYSILFKQLSE